MVIPCCVFFFLEKKKKVSPSLIYAKMTDYASNNLSQGLHQAEILLRESRPQIKPNRGFWKQLEELEAKLGSSRAAAPCNGGTSGDQSQE